MESDKLIEAMARGIEKQPGYIAGAEGFATAALKALRDTLEPVGWECFRDCRLHPRNRTL